MFGVTEESAICNFSNFGSIGKEFLLKIWCCCWEYNTGDEIMPFITVISPSGEDLLELPLNDISIQFEFNNVCLNCYCIKFG